MTHYTLGILFNDELTEVLTIKKTKPDWQKTRYNFPGGHVENGETAIECIIREFKEETNLEVRQWLFIGQLKGPDWVVWVFTAVQAEFHGTVKQLTEEELLWQPCHKLTNVISNLHWLTPFAKDFHVSKDKLFKGTFEYK